MVFRSLRNVFTYMILLSLRITLWAAIIALILQIKKGGSERFSDSGKKISQWQVEIEVF